MRSEKDKKMQIIAFLSDWGNKSYYVGVAKAVIKGIHPSADVIDLTHDIEPWNVREAMYVLSRSFRDFPPNTVFLAVVDYGVGTQRRAIALSTKDGYSFVGPDNGIFTLVTEQLKIKEMVELSNPAYYYSNPPSRTFHGRDIFAPVAAHISNGVPLMELGRTVSKLITIPIKPAGIIKNTLQGEIAYFDRFGNIETNIPGLYLERLALANEGQVTVTIGNIDFPAHLYDAYGEVQPGEMIVHTDSSGFLEIAVNQGNAKQVTGAKAGERVVLKA